MRISGNEGMCRRGSPLDSGRDDDTESIRSEDLNVYHFLYPGLCTLYAKTADKLFQKALLWVNRDVERELGWVINHFLHSDVLHVYCDA